VGVGSRREVWGGPRGLRRGRFWRSKQAAAVILGGESARRRDLGEIEREGVAAGKLVKGARVMSPHQCLGVTG
jgi:hypothetical protein